MVGAGVVCVQPTAVVAQSVTIVLCLCVVSCVAPRHVPHFLELAFRFNAVLQDGAKGYDIIDFCFLRPEFHEVSAAMSQPPCRAVSYLSRRLF